MIQPPGKIAVLWDMDGVIVDTGDFHHLAWVKTFEELGEIITPEQFKATFGMNNAGILEVFFGEKPSQETILKISNRKEELFREYAKGKARLLPGVRSWLERFQEMGAKQAIASSAPPENINALVDELDIRMFFDAIVSGFDLPGKPNPDVFLKAANEVGVEPENCIVIEDAMSGVEGAIRAGMNCIAATTTNTADMLFRADIVLEDLTRLNAGLLGSLFR